MRKIDRPELRRSDADPEGQRGAIDRQALQLHDLGLAIERIVPSEFVDHDTGYKPFGRNAVLDQSFGCWRLDDRALTAPAAVFGAMRHDHLVLGRDLVEALRGLFPDDMHRAVAARANRALGFDRDMDAGKMRRQRTAVDAPLLALVRRLVGRVVLLLFLFGVAVGERGLDILERQLHLIAIKPLRPLAKLRTLELLQQMAELIVLLRQPTALRNGDVALACQLAHQRPQGIEIIRQSVDRHAK